MWIPHSTTIVQFGKDSIAIYCMTNLGWCLMQLSVDKTQVTFAVLQERSEDRVAPKYLTVLLGESG